MAFQQNGLNVFSLGLPKELVPLHNPHSLKRDEDSVILNEIDPLSAFQTDLLEKISLGFIATAVKNNKR